MGRVGGLVLRFGMVGAFSAVLWYDILVGGTIGAVSGTVDGYGCPAKSFWVVKPSHFRIPCLRNIPAPF